MPTAPTNLKCASLGCKSPKSRMSTFCLEHGGRDTYLGKPSKERKERNAMYDQAVWKRMRAAQLSRQPICQACILIGRVSGANHVDHLFAWASVGKDSFYRNVFQSLCAECHSHKTHLEQTGIYRHYHPEGPRDYALNDYGYVLAMHESGSVKPNPSMAET
jgi:hypothetical protein